MDATTMKNVQMLRLVRLVGICHRSEQIFADAIQSSSSKEFRGCMGQIRQVLHEFRFQLLLEIDRLGDGGSEAYLKGEYATTYASCESSLRYVVDTYRHVLNKRLPPHATAMVKRQYEQLRMLYDQFSRFVIVLQYLVDDRQPVAVS